MLTIADLKTQNLILLEAVSGSKAYGLNLPHSDTDIRGVFYLPRADFYGLNYLPQISNETNDEVYYELGRFIELLLQSNPSALELLYSPPECVLYRSPLLDWLVPSDFLSKQCQQTFAGYAVGQIKKAQGLNKKIVNPIAKEKKSLLDFCYIIENGKSHPLNLWLEIHHIQQEQLGLSTIEHSKNLYAVYVDCTQKLGYQGLLKKAEDSMLIKSHIPTTESLVAYLSFNLEGYQSYCKDYHAYWKWVEERNEERYLTNQSHGKNYDAKNLMDTFRLLETAKDIALHHEVRVKRPNRAQLLAIRRGEFDYPTLIEQAKHTLKEIEALFNQSNLPDQPNRAKALQALINIRKSLYGGV